MPGTLTVGCKLPNGLKLQLYRTEEWQEPVMGGGHRKAIRAVPESDAVSLNGCARYVGKDAPHPIQNGAGLTFGVDADLFAEWMRRNKDTEIVRNGFVFAQTKAADAAAQAKDHASLRTGLEPLDPENLPAEFRGKVKTADVK